MPGKDEWLECLFLCLFVHQKPRPVADSRLRKYNENEKKSREERRLSAGLRAEQNVSGRFVADNYDKGREEEKK